MQTTTKHVRGALAGEEEDLGWVIQRFSPFLEVQVRLRIGGRGTPEDVEDLVADVWVITLRRLQDLRPREGRYTPALAKFLGTTALRVSNSFLRRMILRGSSRGREAPESRELPLQRTTRSILGRLANDELVARIRAYLERMPAEKRDVLVLRLLEDRTNPEIADLLKLRPNTVAVRYRRALEELRRALPEVYPVVKRRPSAG